MAKFEKREKTPGTPDAPLRKADRLEAMILDEESEEVVEEYGENAVEVLARVLQAKIEEANRQLEAWAVLSGIEPGGEEAVRAMDPRTSTRVARKGGGNSLSKSELDITADAAETRYDGKERGGSSYQGERRPNNPRAGQNQGGAYSGKRLLANGKTRYDYAEGGTPSGGGSSSALAQVPLVKDAKNHLPEDEEKFAETILGQKGTPEPIELSDLTDELNEVFAETGRMGVRLAQVGPFVAKYGPGQVGLALKELGEVERFGERLFLINETTDQEEIEAGAQEGISKGLTLLPLAFPLMKAWAALGNAGADARRLPEGTVHVWGNRIFIKKADGKWHMQGKANSPAGRKLAEEAKAQATGAPVTGQGGGGRDSGKKPPIGENRPRDLPLSPDEKAKAKVAGTPGYDEAGDPAPHEQPVGGTDAATIVRHLLAIHYALTQAEELNGG